LADAPSHLDLVAVVAAIGQAARTEDADGMHRALCRLRTGLAEHVAGEAAAVDGMAPAVADRVRIGQRRLLGFVDDLLGTTDGDEPGCACIVRAAELRALVQRQIRLEGALRRTA
jgi:hypothetical protein